MVKDIFRGEYAIRLNSFEYHLIAAILDQQGSGFFFGTEKKKNDL